MAALMASSHEAVWVGFKWSLGGLFGMVFKGWGVGKKNGASWELEASAMAGGAAWGCVCACVWQRVYDYVCV